MWRALILSLLIMIFQAFALSESARATCASEVIKSLRAKLDREGFDTYLRYHPPQAALPTASTQRAKELIERTRTERPGVFKLPTQERNPELYEIFRANQKDPDFVRELFAHPDVWKIYEEFALTNAEKVQWGAARQAAQEALKLISESGYTLVPRQATHPALYKRMWRSHEHPAYLAEIKTDPRAVAAFQFHQASPAFQAAWDTIAYIERNGEIVSSRKNDQKVYMRYYRYRSDPDYLAVIDQNPKAIQVFEQTVFTPEQNDALKAADFAIESIAKLGHRSVPDEKAAPSLASKLIKYRADVFFLVRLKRDPNAYRVFVEWNRNRMSGPNPGTSYTSDN